MCKYKIANRGVVVKCNAENQDFSILENTYANIDYMYIIDEDGIVTTKDGTEIPVNKDDILLVLYGIEKFKGREYFVITNSKLKDYYTRLNEYDKEKETLNSSDTCEAT